MNIKLDTHILIGLQLIMLNGNKIVVVMPAYNAARTLQRTYEEVMEQGIVDLVIVVDDASHDETVAIARTLSILAPAPDRNSPRICAWNSGSADGAGAGERHRDLAGEQIIAGVASADFDLVAFAAETFDGFDEEDFTVGHLSIELKVEVERNAGGPGLR